MKSKTSLFEPALFRKNLTRFAPLWVIFLGIMLLSGPVGILIARHSALMEDQLTILSDYFLTRRYAVVLYNFIYAPLCAGMLFHYLHYERSAYMMHAYPLNRSTQFVTNVLSGFCFAAAPFVLQFCLNLLSSAGLAGQSYLWKLLVLELLSFAFFYGLAVFCMLLSGNSIISVLSYFVLNFVFAAVPALLIGLINSVSFGFDFSALDDKLIYLAPALRMMSTIVNDTSDITRAEWITFGVYGLLGGVLLVLAWLLYRVRHLEQAGEAMVFRWARITFLALFTLICTLGLGVLLTELFVESVGSWRQTLPLTLLFLLLASFAGWFGAQMMLRRTVRVFRMRTVLGWICIAAVTVALICGLQFDVLGIQRYVPAQEELQGATLMLNTNNYSQRYNLDIELHVTDPEVLAAVRTAHRDAYSFYRDKGQHHVYQFKVHYRLRSGRTVRREFEISEENMMQFNKLLDKPEYATQYYEAILPKAFQGKKYFRLEYYDPYSKGENELIRICTDRDALQEALLLDAAEGNLTLPFIVTEKPFGWNLTANVAPEMYGDTSSLEITNTAKHTLLLFGVEP